MTYRDRVDQLMRVDRRDTVKRLRTYLILLILILMLWLGVAASVVAQSFGIQGVTMWANVVPARLWMWVEADPAVPSGPDHMWDLSPVLVQFNEAPDSLRICVMISGTSRCKTLGEFRAWATTP